MAYIYKSFSKMFGVDEDDNSQKNKNNNSSNKLVKIVMKQTRVRWQIILLKRTKRT